MAIYKLQGIVLVLSRYRSKSLSSSRRFEENGSSLFVDRFRNSYSNHERGITLSKTHIPMAKNDNMSPDIDGSSMPSSFPESANDGKQPPPRVSPGPKPRFPVWIRWVAGSILSLLLSMWMPKWSTLIRIGGEAEVVMQEVEQAAEVMEKVATVAERVAEQVADQLPDHTKLKQAATLVENISKEAAKDAHLAEEIIHEVDSVEKDLENLETLVEPLINKIIHDKKS